MKRYFSYPKWKEIPNIDLYLDQVLLYVNQVCEPISSGSEKGLTASMVNNYVKHGYLTKPEKEKISTQTNRTIDCYYHSQVYFFLSKKLLKPLIPYTQTLIQKNFTMLLWTI